ncbi:MAG TPA: ATP-dependent DNA helicase RecG [Ignavibacteriaceae bacterium]|nr:ATP-dependent DNA helicase RecG [Ignavibacteriaceae bacterium]
MKSLNEPIQYLKSVGPKRAASFTKVGIKTVKDLLYYFPSKYLDRTTLLSSSEAYNIVERGYDGEITVIGKVTSKEKRIFNRKEILKVAMRDREGFFECVWFQGAKYFENKFDEGEVFAVSAKPSISKFNNLQFVHPDFDRISEDESQTFYSTGKIIPFYRIPKELKATNIGDISLRKMLTFILDGYLDEIEDTLPPQLIEKNSLLDLSSALRFIHYPENMKQVDEARIRFKYEELFYLELLVALRKNNYKEKVPGISFQIKSKLVPQFIKTLPFELTSAQKHVLTEIKNDMLSEKPMNRLLQGDVGSGKTIVALIAMLIAIDSGYQAAIMAPTEILADQHARNISKMMNDLYTHFPERKIKVSLLIGGQKKTEREKRLEEIELQEADIIVGTHAIFEQNVKFKNLGLIVIDEQHRFGVVQRAELIKKAASPDIIVMSATPIPRTLSMTVYGDLDVSIINEMPKNRKPIRTLLRGETKLPEIYQFINEKAKEGCQSFIVYPLVEESEKLELKAAVTYFEELSKTYLKELRVGLIHGRMKWREKEDVMLLFAAKEYDVIISTTVIEVGIDIPSANIMLINDAHRFGLSQLHQLRGRVGRGAEQAYCILVTKDEITAASARLKDKLEYLSPVELEKYKSSIRLQTMVKYTDGFKIAEIDMKLRGPGDIFGIQQSGFPALKYADLTTDVEILLNAKRDAFKIIEEDPKIFSPQNAIARKNLIEHYSDNLKYAKIG